MTQGLKPSRSLSRFGLGLAGALALGASLLSVGCGDTVCWALDCGGRDAKWDADLQDDDYPPQAVGLTGSVAVYDRPLDRVLMLTSGGNLDLAGKSIAVGKNVATMKPSTDHDRLYVLSRGVQPRVSPDDELPSLTVIEGDSSPKRLARYELTDPLSGLAVDPLGEWVVVYDAGGVVVNPNELILVKVDDPSVEPIAKTIRSFGARPQRLTFTSELKLPNGPARRLLIVETEQDVTLVDLLNPLRDEVTIVLPKTPSGVSSQPAQVAFHDGNPDDVNDARVAIRLAGESDVVILELGPSAEEGKDFKPTVNVADVGGVPSSIDFVETDGGLRLAALVPANRQAALVDPATTVVESVGLPGGYSQLARVTDSVAEKPDFGDVALLWGGSQADGIAFWSLGRTTGKPYRSVDAYQIGINVTAVQDVPGDELGQRKILVGQGASEFYVLDLDARTSFPMLTNQTGFDLSVAPDGGRAWALRRGTPEFAQVDLGSLHPTSLEVQRDVSAVFDIERRDGGRALVALHGTGNLGATVLDALDPDSAATRFYPGLLLGDL
ncbi:MAG: hypothetical protein KC766_34930 [Myxococcales bacterium]|nr:hypothetical protein [Myxococcales bacterium]